MTTTIKHNGAEDFNFFIGNWSVSHRRLKERLANCHEWQEFAGTCTVMKILGGQGNFDDNFLELPDAGYRAATLRSFDEATGLWSIWWLDSRFPGQLDTPVRGRFENKVGQFFADDSFAGLAIRVRFLWTQTNPDAPRWEQAFSVDGGVTWETNWTMDFKRTA